MTTAEKLSRARAAVVKAKCHTPPGPPVDVATIRLAGRPGDRLDVVVVDSEPMALGQFKMYLRDVRAVPDRLVWSLVDPVNFFMHGTRGRATFRRLYAYGPGAWIFTPEARCTNPAAADLP